MTDNIKKKCNEILNRIQDYHLIKFEGESEKVFLISSTYPGVWMEHVYDAISWVNYDNSHPEISKAQIKLFLSRQKEDGQLPCYVINQPDTKSTRIGYSQIQECVSFGRLCIEAYEQNKDMDLLVECYEKCQKWDEWLVRNRMTTGNGLIEMFCGFDTGHDNSGRLIGVKYPGKICNDAAVKPSDCDILPMIAPDMNAVFYGDRMALSDMAKMLGKIKESEFWYKKAEEVKKKLFDICYDEADMFFYDVDKNGNKRKCKSISITNLFTEGVLDYELGNEIFERYLNNPSEFRTPYPYPSVSISDPTWVQNLKGNSWGFYSQGLTALRTLRWMDKYGRSAELEENMKAWVSAWSNSDKLNFGQELHPITGEPSSCSEWYSSCMLYFIHSVKRLSTTG